LLPAFSFGQNNVTASFTGPDTVCVNTPVQFTNTSQNASNYLWSFCSDFKTTPTAKNIGAGNLNLPVFIDYGLDDNGNYYGIVTNHLIGRITRLNFGNSLLNTPTSEDLGDFNGALPEQLEGVQLEQVNGKWYAIAVGGGNEHPNSSPRIVKLDFGNSLANTPVATNWGNLGQLDLPIDFYIAKENNNYYGFAFNVYSNTITRFDFGNDFVNPPAAINLGNIGNLDYPDGFTFIKNNNVWYAFAVNTYPGSITRLDFGSSLTTTPTATVINNPGGLLAHPRDITFLTTCNGIFAYIINADDNKLIKLNFGSDITNTNPNATDLGSFDFYFPHSFSEFFTDGTSIYTFVPNVNSNSIDRLKFAGCNSIDGSTKKNPDPITYTEAGTYNVNLMIDIGLPTQTSSCKQIIVNSCVPPVTASFTAPDTVCKNTPLKITNTSTGASNYLWSFCNGFNTNPVSTNLGNIGNDLILPVFSDYGLDDNGNYYAIVTDHYPGKITRLNFGNSLLNTPVAEDLGNFNGVVPNQVEGVQVIKANGKWYAIAVGGGNAYQNSSPRILKLDFGNSLANIPIATNWGNVGNLDLPIDFYIAEENGNYYGFTMNVNSNTITRFDFGNDFINPPSGTNLGNIGNLDYPDGFTFIKSNNIWYAFALNAFSNTITRLTFGNALTNKPSSFVIQNPGGLLNSSRDISILSTCNGIYGYVLNAGDNKIIQLDFGSDITSIPTAKNLGTIGNYNFPHSFSDFFTDGTDIYSFIPTVNSNSLNRLRFKGCQEIKGSTKQNPDPVIYDSAGVYTISLMVDIGLPTQTYFCKPIVVNNCDTICDLKAKFSYTQTTCDPTIIQFHDSTINADSISWDFGNGQTDTARSPIIKYDNYGQYIVHLYAKTTLGCKDTATDTINVDIKIDSAIITKDTAICAGSSIQLNAIKGLSYCWSPSKTLSDSSIQNPVATPKTTTTYYLNILIAKGQQVAHDSITVTVIPLPVVDAGNDVSVCKGSSIQLNATGANTYYWNYSTSLSDTLVANPIATPDSTTNYIVTGYNLQGCFNKDTVKVSVLSLPIISIINDTAICVGGSIMLHANAGGQVSYSWSPLTGLSNTNISNPIANPVNSTKYFVTVTDSNSCVSIDSMNLSVLPVPTVSTLNDTGICQGTSLVLKTTSSNATIFNWAPSATLDSSTTRSPKASPLTTTLYTVSAGNGICDAKDSVLISLLSLPNVNAGNDTTVCGNNSAQLNASGAVSYVWSPIKGLSDPNIANPIALPGNTTTYHVTGTGENSCTNSDSVTVFVQPPPGLGLTPKNISICNGDSVLLTASGGDIYSWSPVETVLNTTSAATEVFPSVNTTYKVVVTNIVCKVIDSFTSNVSVKISPTITITKSNDIDCINLQAQLMATGGVNFKWTPDKYITNTGIDNPIVNPPSNTWYYVNVKGENGCKNEDSILVTSTINADAAVFDVPNAFTPNHDGLNDCFSVKYWGPADYFSIEIYDRWGYLVYHSNNINACWNGTISSKPQPSGTYVYKISVSSKCTNNIIVHKKGTIVLIR